MIETFLLIIVWIAVVFLVGWLAKYVIETFFPEPIRTPAMVLVGVILLILVVVLVARLSGSDVGWPKKLG